LTLDSMMLHEFQCLCYSSESSARDSIRDVRFGQVTCAEMFTPLEVRSHDKAKANMSGSAMKSNQVT